MARVLRRVASGEYLINDSVLSRPNVASRVLHQFQELSVLDEAAEESFLPSLVAKSRFSNTLPRETATRRSPTSSASPTKR